MRRLAIVLTPPFECRDITSDLDPDFPVRDKTPKGNRFATGRVGVDFALEGGAAGDGGGRGVVVVVVVVISSDSGTHSS